MTLLGCSLAFAACGRREAPPPAPVVATVGNAADAATVDVVSPSDASSVAKGPCPVAKAALGPGLVAERWHVDATPVVGEPCIDVVRADLAHYALRAFHAERKPAPTWASEQNLVAVTNAGMFADDGATPVGLVIADGKTFGVDNTKFSGFLAWDPVSPDDKPLIVAGRSCPGFDLDALRKRYRSLVQSYRLLGCDGAALPWQDPKQYSAAAIGVDRSGRVVFLHARAGFTMKELSAALATHDLAGALFLEGGPEASLVVRGKDGSLDLNGSYETGFVENDQNTAFWELPNVIGLSAR